jgi:hypothetical protein
MPCQIAECWIKPVTTLHSEIINICAWLSFSEFFYDDTKHLYLPNTLIINIYHPCSRVQWFWQFFRNSICFMCFWFGLEILIKKCFLKYWTVSILFDLLSFEKSSVAMPLMRVQKKFLRNWVCRVSKEAEFCADFKNVFFVSFFWEQIFENFLTQEFYTFLKSVQNSASFDILQAQFWRNLFSTLITNGAVFLEVKSSNKI